MYITDRDEQAAFPWSIPRDARKISGRPLYSVDKSFDDYVQCCIKILQFIASSFMT